jgi:hypothetical protein
VTLTFHALWMLCALGSVVLAAAAAGTGVPAVVAMAVAFLAAVRVFGAGALPDPGLAGVVAVAAAAIFLFRPRYAVLAAALGGALGGMWTGLLEVQGLSSVAAAAVAAVVLGVSRYLARTRPAFAPEQLRDEGLLAIGVLGLVVATLPGVLDGWQAATNLAATSDRASQAIVPAWTIALLLSSTTLGAAYSLWSRR